MGFPREQLPPTVRSCTSLLEMFIARYWNINITDIDWNINIMGIYWNINIKGIEMEKGRAPDRDARATGVQAERQKLPLDLPSLPADRQRCATLPTTATRRAAGREALVAAKDLKAAQISQGH